MKKSKTVKRKAKKSPFNIDQLEDKLRELALQYQKSQKGEPQFIEDLSELEDEGFLVVMIRRDNNLPTHNRVYCSVAFGGHMPIEEATTGLGQAILGLYLGEGQLKVGKA